MIFLFTHPGFELGFAICGPRKREGSKEAIMFNVFSLRYVEGIEVRIEFVSGSAVSRISTLF